MVPVERRLKTPDVQCLHDATVVPVRDTRRENRKIAGPEVVSMFVCVCHDGRFGRSRPGKHRRGKVLFALPSCVISLFFHVCLSLFFHSLYLA